MAKGKKTKLKWPKLPSFLVPLFQSANVYLCRTREEWHQACVYLGTSPDGIEMLQGVATCYRNEKDGENLYLIGVFNDDISTLVHECAHIAFYTCRDVGVTVEVDSANETYCYLLDRMVTHFLPQFMPAK